MTLVMCDNLQNSGIHESEKFQIILACDHNDVFGKMAIAVLLHIDAKMKRVTLLIRVMLPFRTCGFICAFKTKVNDSCLGTMEGSSRNLKYIVVTRYTLQLRDDG